MHDSLNENDVAHDAEQYEVLPKGCYSQILPNVRPKPVKERVLSDSPNFPPDFSDEGHSTRRVVPGDIITDLRKIGLDKPR